MESEKRKIPKLRQPGGNTDLALRGLVVLIIVFSTSNFFMLFDAATHIENNRQDHRATSNDSSSLTRPIIIGGITTAAVAEQDDPPRDPPESRIEQQPQQQLKGGYPLPTVDLGNQPQWIQDYFAWHNQVRTKFPGRQLFTDPNAPPLLIRTCSAVEPCGGLNDRLGKLPWDLYLANQTRRVLLMSWCKPVPLEEFLLPNAIDWSIPVEQDAFFQGSEICSNRVHHLLDLFKGYKSARPQDRFWTDELDDSLVRATTAGTTFHDAKILKHRILGDEVHLRERLQQLGETDMLDWSSPSYGQLFWLFFRPSPGLLQELNAVYNKLQLVPHHYSAVHCRVRHPKAVPIGALLEAKGPGGGPDKVGLLWQGESRRFAIETATRALKCASTMLVKKDDQTKEPIFFYSDSEDLVRYMAHELTNDTFLANHTALFESSPTDAAARELVRSHQVVAPVYAMETLHIDRQFDQPKEAYYPSFIDLLIAVQARCVAVGVGNFALFAAKLSEKPCVVQYQGEAWGQEGAKESMAIRQCPTDI